MGLFKNKTKSIYTPDYNNPNQDFIFYKFNIKGAHYFLEDLNKLQNDTRYYCTLKPAVNKYNKAEMGLFIDGKQYGWIDAEDRDAVLSLLQHAKLTLAYIFNEYGSTTVVLEIAVKHDYPDTLRASDFRLEGTKYFKSITTLNVHNYACTFTRVPNKYNPKAVRVLIDGEAIGFVAKEQQAEFDSILPELVSAYVNIDQELIRVYSK